MLRIVALLLMLCAQPLWAERVYEGTARVTDGDTLRVGGQVVRLFGIDAPEMDQRCTRDGRPWNCGAWARDTLRALVRGRTLRCTEQDRDGYGRSVALCTVAGRDVGDALVRAGAALAFQRYSMRYVDAEKAAIFAGAGLWQGEFTKPWDHRAAPAMTAAPAAEAPAGCVIKGNISSSGRIFHVPGQRDYAATRINTAKGERWFCSAAEARAAGWRAARR